MRIYPAVHYTMGGLWVDYNLMSTIPGLFVLGEANFSDHGANRLGASALMQGLADGYFVLPYTIGDYLAQTKLEPRRRDARRRSRSRGGGRRARRNACWRSRASAPSTSFHRELGKIMWDNCGMARNEPGPRGRRWRRSRSCARSSGRTCSVAGRGRRAQPGAGEGRARGRLPGVRRAACAATRWRARNPAAAISARSTRPPTARRMRDDEKFCHVAAWEYAGPDRAPVLHKEPLDVRERPAGDEELQVAMRTHAERLAAEERGGDRAASCTYEANDVSPDMSFLEMLDVVNEDLIAQGRGADRLRPRLPRRHLRHVRRGDQRHPARPGDRGTTTCQLHMRQLQGRRRSTSSRGARKAFPVITDLIVDRSAFDRIIAGRRLHLGAAPARRPTATRSRSRRTTPTWRWTPPRASAAAPAWPPARTPRPCSSSSAKVSHLALLPQGQPSAGPRAGDGRADGRRRLRRLHQPRRVRGGLPEGDQPRVHRRDEPRLRPRRACARADVNRPARTPRADACRQAGTARPGAVRTCVCSNSRGLSISRSPFDQGRERPRVREVPMKFLCLICADR